MLNISNKLQTKHIKTIALIQYAVGQLGDIKSLEDWMIDELNKLGIKFNFAFKNLNQTELYMLPKFNGRHPLYKQGILC